jgi:hypothetical protein
VLKEGWRAPDIDRVKASRTRQGMKTEMKDQRAEGRQREAQ